MRIAVPDLISNSYFPALAASESVPGPTPGTSSTASPGIEIT